MRISDGGSSAAHTVAPTEHEEKAPAPAHAEQKPAQHSATPAPKSSKPASANRPGPSEAEILFNNAMSLVGRGAQMVGDVVKQAGKGEKAVEKSAADIETSASRTAKEAVREIGNVGKEALNATGRIAAQVAKDGPLNVAAHVAQNTAVQLGRIAQGWVAHPDPGSFAKWLAGPDSPGVSDFTQAVPGLQQGIDDVMNDAMKENPLISGAIGKAFGFEYVPGENLYTTNKGSIQSLLGYHVLYDMAGKVLGMDLKNEVVNFTDKTDGVQYQVELWKGNYGAGGSFGGEIGIYTKGAHDRGPMGDALETIPGYYSSANGSHQIQMTQEIYDTRHPDQPYFEHSTDGDHYWNLAIRTQPGVDSDHLGQRGSMVMNDTASAQALCKAMNAKGEQMARAGEGTLTASIGQDGKTVNYTWE